MKKARLYYFKIKVFLVLCLELCFVLSFRFLFVLRALSDVACLNSLSKSLLRFLLLNLASSLFEKPLVVSGENHHRVKQVMLYRR